MYIAYEIVRANKTADKIQNDKMHNMIDIICCNTSFLYHVWHIKNKLYINIYSS